MSNLHTPGPWQLCHGGMPGDDGFSISSKISREVVCERWPCTCDNNDRARMIADSLLIAAAPELLEAVLVFVKAFDRMPDDTYFGGKLVNGDFAKAKAIVAKATGVIR